MNIAHPDVPTVLKILSHKAEPEDIMKAAEYISGMPDKEKEEGRLIMELSYRINGDRRGGLDMGGFFEAYVDPLQEIIKQQNEELEQKEAALEQYKAELAQKDAIIASLRKHGAVEN